MNGKCHQISTTNPTHFWSLELVHISHVKHFLHSHSKRRSTTFHLVLSGPVPVVEDTVFRQFPNRVVMFQTDCRVHVHIAFRFLDVMIPTSRRRDDVRPCLDIVSPFSTNGIQNANILIMSMLGFFTNGNGIFDAFRIAEGDGSLHLKDSKKCLVSLPVLQPPHLACSMAFSRNKRNGNRKEIKRSQTIARFRNDNVKASSPCRTCSHRFLSLSITNWVEWQNGFVCQP